MPAQTRPAVFIDKDGTLVEDLPFNVDPGRIRLAPGAREGLVLLHACGYRLIVVSNQSGVARGLFSEADLLPVRLRLQEILAEFGVPLDGFYYCPHHPEGKAADYAVSCRCRKPEPGLILQAAREQRADPTRSWMVGDILDDIEAGRRAGCRTALICNGNETEWNFSARRSPDLVAADFAEAAYRIVLRDGRLSGSRRETLAGQRG